MASYSLPPWIGDPANPAANYQSGLQIGVRIGAEQAAQQYQQQQLLRAQQQDEFERQFKAQQQEIEIDQITRKQRAIADYQSMLQQGVDPMVALRQVGVAMGESPARIAEIEAMNQRQAAERQATEAWRASQLDLSRQRLDVSKARAPQGSGSAPATVATARAMDAAQLAVDKAQESGDLQALKLAERSLENLNKAQSLQHQDPNVAARRGIIVSAIKNIDKMQSGEAAAYMTPERKAKLTQDREALMKELQGEQPAAPGATVAAPETAAPAVRRLRFEAGKFLPVE